MRNTYREYQKIDHRVRLLFLVLSILSACLLILSDYLNFQLHVLVLISAMIVAFIYILTITFKFSTVIYKECIYITFWPFFKTSIKISEVTEIEEVTYDLPGFGVRHDIPNSVTYYKAAGNTGLSLTLVNHKTVVIGTRRATEIKTYLEQLKLTALPAPNS
jgi:hypothetical protein